MLNLLLRFYDPISGQVLLDGRDLRSIQRDSFRSHFALVQQETFLFNDSILDNIRYGHNGATSASSDVSIKLPPPSTKPSSNRRDKSFLRGGAEQHRPKRQRLKHRAARAGRSRACQPCPPSTFN